MNILELLRKALAWEGDDYRNMPDYSTILDHLGLTEDDDPELIRECIQDEIESLEVEADDDDAGEESTDVGE
ncbi:MAG: hypothetical protein K8F92_04740 [Hyphomicrobium sp.]|uniref:hypothetical protein n=1 Tax=Hyphomicrobium sp. TaxID=82 RepID=UPI0013276663|nr:hypothetical protein [Hyphomicrobium sp.]KAB2943067.1 MAG: hypothetical protein F9K20_03300 [Hyphomicrobium sp.]MBZ0208942.1 hypothetical protein [Hyphomicrobium sp.]